MWTTILTILLLPRPVAMAPRLEDPVQIAAKVQGYYESTQKLKSHFRQVYKNVVFGKESASDGVLMVKKPGLMRWDYVKPEPKHFISDGKILWVYEPAQKQAFKQNLEDQLLPVAVTFLYGQGKLLDDFTATLDTNSGYGRKTDYVLKLVPKKPSAQYKNLWLVVDPGDFHVRESVILEASDNVNHFKFYDLRLNDKAVFEDKHFKFKPPKGVKVIEPQSQQGSPSR